MNRRALLSSCAVVAVGGCLGTDRRTPARIAWIWLRNDRAQRHPVDVSVTDGGETVFSDAYQLPPADSGGTDIRITHPVDGPGQYVVRATMDGETRHVETAELVDGDEDCLGVRFSLLDNGSVDYWTKSMRQC